MPAQGLEVTFETHSTSAESPGLRLETRNTFAAGKTLFFSLLPPAEVTSVSPTHKDRQAKVPTVSQRSICHAPARNCAR